jgi:PleD family two-component response regulator
LSKDTDTMDTIMQRADKALYAAKNKGRDCIEVYE